MQYEVISLKGPRPFREVQELQLDLLNKRIADQIPDTFIIHEHTSVITRGRGLQYRQDRTEKAKALPFLPPNTDYVEIERGGDLTWHGPGQLVVYPIVKLVHHDVDAWIRFLENIWIDSLKEFGIQAQTQEGGSGVWIGAKKVASVGIALRKWVNYHGIAINIVNDLSPFFAFDPCGYEAQVMTRLQDLPQIPRELFQENWREIWEQRFLLSLKKTLSKV